MKRVLVLGATSEIAQAVQRIMVANGKALLLVGRSAERLAAVQSDLLARGAAEVKTLQADLGDCSQHDRLVNSAIIQFGPFDTVFLAYGSLLDQASCQVEPDLAIREITTNFSSAVSLLTRFAKVLEEHKSGTIAVITSVAGDRGRRSNYVYGAAKGGLTIFLQGLRSRLHPKGVRVITIKPGPVVSPMTAEMKKNASFSTPEKIAGTIYESMEKRHGDVLYVPGMWRWVMWVIRAVPERIFKRLSI